MTTDMSRTGTPAARCRHCQRRGEDTFPVAKTGGGTYRRASRSYVGQTCVTCVESALRHACPQEREGVLTLRANNSWDTQGLITALVTFLRRGTTDMDRDRWAVRYAISGHHFIPFDDWFTALTSVVERHQQQQSEAPEPRA